MSFVAGALALLAAFVALGSAGGGSDVGSVTVKSEPAPEVSKKAARKIVVWAVGDGADGGSEGKAVARMIAADKPDRMLYLGDVYERGTAAEFKTNYQPLFGALKRITLPTPGNHDWDNHNQGYDPYWDGLANGRLPRGHYGVRMAGWELLSLNSQASHDPGSEQVQWLKKRVATGGTCRIAFWHRPRYSAATKHGDQGDLAPFWETLAGRARLVLGGHEHNMQRLRRVDGIVQLISGAGGRGHYELDRSDPRLVFGDAESNGALRLVLKRRKVRWRFVATGGKILDRGKLGCKPGRR